MLRRQRKCKKELETVKATVDDAIYWLENSDYTQLRSSLKILSTNLKSAKKHCKILKA